MPTVRLKCAGARALFYEPDGLLLSSSLAPVDEQHRNHLLTFQLSYLGFGDIAVDVARQGGVTGHELTYGGGDVDGGPSFSGGPDFVEVVLNGMTSSAPPGVWLTSVIVPDAEVHYRLTVWGKAGGDDGLRGELTADVWGCPPLLTATTRASVTWAETASRNVEMAECVVLTGPWAAAPHT